MEEVKEKTNPVKIIFKVIGNIIVYLFLLLAIGGVVFTLTSKKSSDGASTVFNYQLRVVISDSMNKCDEVDVSSYEIKSIKVKSLVVVKTFNEEEEEDFYSSLKIGDVLTFRYVYTSQETITHRIVNIESKQDGGYLISLQGDNRGSSSGVLTQIIDTSLKDSPNYIIGKVVYVSYPLGVITYALKTTVGSICIIIIPCVLIVIYELIKIIGIIRGDKEDKKDIYIDQKEREIEELKKQIEELSKKEGDK